MADILILGPELRLRPAPGHASQRLPGQVRRLLAVLLTAPGQPCSHDLLTRALWPGTPPRNPAQGVASAVSRAREALRTSAAASTTITARPGGYQATPPPGTLDTDRYRRLHAAARTAARHGNLPAAARLAAAALTLWEDPPLADLPRIPGTRHAAAALLTLRQETQALLRETALATGNAATVLPDLHAQAAASPGSETAWTSLITGLAQARRTAEALDACTAARTALAARGIRPGPELTRLHAAILNGTPTGPNLTRD